jgi:hypothetical protein
MNTDRKANCLAVQETLDWARERLPWFTLLLVTFIFVTGFVTMVAVEVLAGDLPVQERIALHAALVAVIVGLTTHFLILKPFFLQARLRAEAEEEHPPSPPIRPGMAA